jgi:hypothetical protein
MPSLLEGRISHLEVHTEVPAHGPNTIYKRSTCTSRLRRQLDRLKHRTYLILECNIWVIASQRLLYIC